MECDRCRDPDAVLFLFCGKLRPGGSNVKCFAAGCGDLSGKIVPTEPAESGDGIFGQRHDYLFFRDNSGGKAVCCHQRQECCSGCAVPFPENGKQIRLRQHSLCLCLAQLLGQLGGVCFCQCCAVGQSDDLAGRGKAVVAHQLIQLCTVCRVLVCNQFQMPQKQVFSGRDSGICDGICKRCTVPGDGGFLRVKIVELYRWRLGRLQFHCL